MCASGTIIDGFSQFIYAAIHHKVQFVFEAVSDDLGVKKRVFDQIIACCTAASCSAVLCSASLGVSLAALRKSLSMHKEGACSIVGVRFLLPVLNVPLVEVTRATLVSDDTAHDASIRRAEAFLRGRQKIAFYRRDSDVDGPRLKLDEALARFWGTRPIGDLTDPLRDRVSEICSTLDSGADCKAVCARLLQVCGDHARDLALQDPPGLEFAVAFSSSDDESCRFRTTL